MQINSGPSPLTLAVMKALGVQAPAAAPPAPAAGKAAAPAAGDSPKTTAGPPAGAELSADLPGDPGVARTIPRGSFVDFKA